MKQRKDCFKWTFTVAQSMGFHEILILYVLLPDLQIVTWRDARDMVLVVQRELPKQFALRIRLIETLDGWQDLMISNSNRWFWRGDWMYHFSTVLWLLWCLSKTKTVQLVIKNSALRQAIPELVKIHERLTRWYRDLVLLNYKDPDMKSFISAFKSIRDEGRNTIALSASGIYKLRSKLNKFSQQETDFFDEWLDGFLLSRSWGVGV